MFTFLSICEIVTSATYGLKGGGVLGKLVKFLGSVKTLLVGPDRDDFELEVVPVEVRATKRQLIVSALLTMVTTILGVTIAQVLIIPLFV